MRYLALCCDYDGTLATEGQVFPETAAALERLIASGRRPVLVTGRELDQLQTVCPYLDLFEYVVAENGALLYEPSTRKETRLAQRPPDSFVAALRARGVGPISVGRVIVATWEPHETEVLETIKDRGLELQVIFNKGAVMILPAGVNKATGLAHALKRMGLSPHNAVGVGDAENDHALLALCECGIAVANALPTLKEAADFVTTGARGAGVTELISALLHDDLASHEPELTRHHILLGMDSDEREVRIRPYGENVLLTGTAGSGKSALAATLLEGLCEAGYTFCVVDPDGYYETLAGAVSLGASTRPPSVEEILKLFRSPDQSGVINLSGLQVTERRSFFAKLLPHLTELRERTGRPHWLVIDSEQAPAEGQQTPSVLQITARPSLLEPSALAEVNLLLATGNSPQQMIREFCQMTATPTPGMDPVSLHTGEVLAWRPQVRNAAPFRLRIKPRTR
jgi:hydroxymethylpyrimidine pyrophosphatase-like HAD family hydrolase